MLHGKRVFILEDEPVVALALEDILLSLDCKDIVIATDYAAGLAIAEEGMLDAAILDVNIDGIASFQIADALMSRRVPFFFATGYGTAGLAGHDYDAAVVRKPYSADEIRFELMRVLKARASEAGVG